MHMPLYFSTIRYQNLQKILCSYLVLLFTCLWEILCSFMKKKSNLERSLPLSGLMLFTCYCHIQYKDPYILFHKMRQGVPNALGLLRNEFSTFIFLVIMMISNQILKFPAKDMLIFGVINYKCARSSLCFIIMMCFFSEINLVY